MDSEIRNAIQVHGEWKERLADAIQTGRSQFTVETVCQDDQCRLGRWLYTLSEPTKASHRWRCVQQIHADFHRHAANVLDLALLGNRSAAKAATSYSSGFAQTSARLNAELKAWQQEVVTSGALVS